MGVLVWRAEEEAVIKWAGSASWLSARHGELVAVHGISDHIVVLKGDTLVLELSWASIALYGESPPSSRHEMVDALNKMFGEGG